LNPDSLSENCFGVVNRQEVMKSKNGFERESETICVYARVHNSVFFFLVIAGLTDTLTQTTGKTVLMLPLTPHAL